MDEQKVSVPPGSVFATLVLKADGQSVSVNDLSNEIVNNIQQLHLLRVHNYYKNKFFLQLTDIQKSSLYGIPITTAIGVLVYLVIS